MPRRIKSAACLRSAAFSAWLAGVVGVVTIAVYHHGERDAGSRCPVFTLTVAARRDMLAG